MTSHGFGGVKLKSGKPDPEMVAGLAKQISEIRPVVWAHVVLDNSELPIWNKNEHYAVLFEFDELDKACYEMNHAGLREKIGEITRKLFPEPEHHITVDLWVIGRRSYHNGC